MEVFGLPVRNNLAHVLPFKRICIGFADPATDVDGLVTGAYQPGEKEGADVTTATDDDNSHGSPIRLS
jgi:hypothetical protein